MHGIGLAGRLVAGPPEEPWESASRTGFVQLTIVRGNGDWVARWFEYVYARYTDKEEALRCGVDAVMQFRAAGRQAELWFYDHENDVLPKCILPLPKVGQPQS